MRDKTMDVKLIYISNERKLNLLNFFYKSLNTAS